MEKLETIEFDLGAYKILLQFHGKKEPLVIHFDTPSRRFYFSIIALIANEMKKQGQPGSIHIRKYQNILKLLDRSLSGKHASKHVDAMWAKINMAWRHRLPDLETAAFFKVLDRDIISPYEKGGKYRYECSDVECDTWANLFGYDENNKWRFEFAIDSVSISLNDISVTLGDMQDNSAWKEFVKSLSIQPKAVTREKRAVPRWWKKAAFSLVAVSIVGAATLAIWNFYFRPPPIEPASIEKMVFPLPDVPSIAVLPFVNMSGDPKQEFFSDAITENIITALSKVPRLFVISRQSTFFYKGKPVKVKQVSEEFGVQYVLEGSVQRSADRIRINAQLIDALSGHHLWAERYESDQKDLFAVQDDITMRILQATRVKLSEGEISSAYSQYFRGRQGFDCYLKIMEASKYADRFTLESYYVARRLLEEAISICPENPIGYVRLGWAYRFGAILDKTKPFREVLEKANELTKKALAMDDTLADAHILLSILYRSKKEKEYDKSIAEGRRAVELDPSGSNAYTFYGAALLFASRPEEAIPLLQKAIRLNPNAQSWTFVFLGHAFRNTGRLEEAVSAYKKVLKRAPDHLIAHVALTTVYSLMGREEEARAEAQEVLRINPKFSLIRFKKTALVFKDKSENDMILNAMTKALK